MRINGKNVLSYWHWPVLALFLVGCEDFLVSGAFDRNSPVIIQQFHTDDPDSFITYVGYDYTWWGGHKDIVRVTDAFIARPKTIIAEEIQRWIDKSVHGQLVYVSG